MDAKPDQQCAADKLDDGIVTLDQLRDPGQAKKSNGREHAVAQRRAQSRNEAVDRTEGKAAPDADEIDGPNRNRRDQPHDDAGDYENKKHQRPW